MNDPPSSHEQDEQDRETYLGDGLYVSWDGFYVILRAPRENGVHWVAMEPQVVQEFQKFLRDVRERSTANPLPDRTRSGGGHAA